MPPPSKYLFNFSRRKETLRAMRLSTEHVRVTLRTTWQPTYSRRRECRKHALKPCFNLSCFSPLPLTFGRDEVVSPCCGLLLEGNADGRGVLQRHDLPEVVPLFAAAAIRGTFPAVVASYAPAIAASSVFSMSLMSRKCTRGTARSGRRPGSVPTGCFPYDFPASFFVIVR